MREIPWQRVVEAVADLSIATAYDLSDEMVAALQLAHRQEREPAAAERLGQLLENARLARAERIPLCQDTGLTVVFVEQGRDAYVAGGASGPSATLDDAINEGVGAGYERGFLRKSMVRDPLQDRRNTGTNTPAVIHHRWTSGDRIKLTVMAKGGGCENRSRMAMLKPTAELQEVKDYIVGVVEDAGADACPPLVVGVGLGGNFEMSCVLAKWALLRSLHQPHSDPFYAAIEQDLVRRINQSGIGPAGLGGVTTVLGVMIETWPCHIASLPVAVNIECHSHRHKSGTI